MIQVTENKDTIFAVHFDGKNLEEVKDTLDTHDVDYEVLELGHIRKVNLWVEYQPKSYTSRKRVPLIEDTWIVLKIGADLIGPTTMDPFDRKHELLIYTEEAFKIKFSQV